MAALNRVEYPFDMNVAGLAGSTRYVFPQETLTISETGSRTFLSAVLEVTAETDNLAITFPDVDQTILEVRLGAASFGVSTGNDNLTDSAEQYTIELGADFVAYFNTNFGSGTTQTCDVAVTIVGVNGSTDWDSINLRAKLIITYQFDETHASADTRTGTLYFPLESNLASMPTSLTELGTNQVPDVLAEMSGMASVVFKETWFEIDIGTTPPGATAQNYLAALDAEGEVALNATNVTPSIGGWTSRSVWRRNDLDHSVVHAFKMRAATTGSFHATVRLCVTFTWDVSTSTRHLNQRIVMLTPDQGDTTRSPADSTGNQTHSIEFVVDEPGTLTLSQSAIRVDRGSFPQTGIDQAITAGAQARKVFLRPVPTISSTRVGGHRPFQQRVDSGSAEGAAFTLVRGANSLLVDVERVDAGGNEADHPCTLILTYSSDIDPAGVERHAHTVTGPILFDHTRPNDDHNPATVPGIEIPDADYYLHDYTIRGTASGLVGSRSLLISTPRPSSGGWAHLYTTWAARVDQENGVMFVSGQMLPLFLRWPGDPGVDRFDAEVERVMVFQFSTAQTWHWNLQRWYTFSAMPRELAGTVIGAGSGETVRLHRADTGEHLGDFTTGVGGAWTPKWYATGIDVYGSTLVGALAGRSLDFALE